MAENNATITRDYLDNTAVKQYAEETLVPKYFPDIDVSLRTVGTIGYTTELITNISEDAFNATSVLFRESFANRAQLSESVYSHAALFQFSNIFSTAASCRFLLVLEEEAIINNMTPAGNNATTGISSNNEFKFYIDKNTQIFVEDIVFSLDYDIEITIVHKTSTENDEYLFTARYMMEYKNSISEVTDPYVKVRRSSDGYLALEVYTHQIERQVQTENLIASNLINFPVIDIDFDGQLAGFDVIYKAPPGSRYLETIGASTTGVCQLEKKIIFSQAIKMPFCYYQLLDYNTLRISFNANDNFFIPENNAEIEITIYLTDGADGNFDQYDGNDISLLPNTERFDYSNTYLTAAKPIGSSEGGMDNMDEDGLQSLAVEGYRTALAITTDNDLDEYFGNYKYRYGNADIMFIKKRNDIAERIYSAFILMRKNDYIYNTNTLKLDINLYDLRYDDATEKDIFILEPGTIFKCNKAGYADFYYDPILHEIYYNGDESTIGYSQILESINYPYQVREDGEGLDSQIWLYPDKRLAPSGKADMVVSYGQWKNRHGYVDTRSVFDLSKEVLEFYDDPTGDPPQFYLINPFLTRFKKNPNLVSHYLTYVRNASSLDFTKQDEDAYVQFIGYTLNINRDFSVEKKYKMNFQCTPSIDIDVNYPAVYVKDEYDEFTGTNDYNVNDKYHTELNDLRVFLVIEDQSKYICSIELYPTNVDDMSHIYTFDNDVFTDDHITSNGFLRLLNGVRYIHDEYRINAIKAVYEESGSTETWEDFLANYGDAITYIDKLELNDESLKKYCYYFEAKPGDATTYYKKYLYDWEESVPDPTQGIDVIHYHYAGEIIIQGPDDPDPGSESWNSNDVMEIYNDGLTYKWFNVRSMTTATDIFVPYEDVLFKVITVYKKYLAPDASLQPITDEYLATHPGVGNYIYTYYDGNEQIVDKALKYYNDTNEYKTVTSPITLIKPLNNVRTTLTFKDYISKTVDPEGHSSFINLPFDVLMKNVPFLRAKTCYNEELFNYFLDSFYDKYQALTDIIYTRLREETSIDIKFYNTYGFANYFVIGEDEEKLDTVNLSLDFDIWYVPGTDPLEASAEVKDFIKSSVETLNERRMNSLYISNLMRKIEQSFSYVDHIRFNHINRYDTEYQAVKNYAVDLDTELTAEERREYVPEFLVIDLEDIHLSEYFID